MKIIKTAALTKARMRDLAGLEAACQTEGSAPVRFPLEDADSVFLLYETDAGDRLAAALFLIMPQIPDSNEPAECIAYTHPALRRKGYFSRLFEAAKAEIEETDLFFPVSQNSEGALKALEALGADFSHAEYRMELSLAGRAASFGSAGQGPLPQDRDCAGPLLCTVTEEADDVRSYSFSLGNGEDAVCHTVRYQTSACLYGLSVRPGLRNQGLGSRCLLRVLTSLAQEGARLVFLHVSGDNLPAVSLYKKTGFRVTETLSYYLY
ncbi:N-acetyltransferase [Clostridiaceae bacterium]|nr:N-acetyltransferase [Clostridiaceae bacterium]